MNSIKYWFEVNNEEIYNKDQMNTIAKHPHKLLKKGSQSNIFEIELQGSNAFVDESLKELKTIVSDPIVPKYSLGDEVTYCGITMKISKVEPCNIDAVWRIHYVLTDPKSINWNTYNENEIDRPI